MNKVQWSLTAGVLVVRQDGSNKVNHCVACDKAVSELLPHLQGKDHYNNLAWYILNHPSPSKLLLDALSGVVKAAKLNKELELVDKTLFSYRCLVCHNKASFSGIKTLEAHLNGRDHKKASLLLSQTLPQQHDVPHPISTPPSVSHHLPQQFRSDNGATALHPDSVCKERLHPDIMRALKERVVVSTGPTSFKCQTCIIDATGPEPLLEHLRSDKHKRKASSQPLPDQMELSDDGPATFPKIVVPNTSFRPPSETVYRNLSSPRGLVLIFNYYFTGNRDHERHGAQRDSFNLKTLFTRMGYKVYLYEDLSKTKTEETLQKNMESPFLRNYDSLIVFILSHGKDDMYFYTGSCRDEDCMTLDDVRYCFTDTSCPALKGKPKLFFVNFCRGKLKEPQTQYDSVALQNEAPKDMVTMYACISRYQAPRDPQNGTVFVQVLCEVLAAHAHDMELHDLHNQVCDLVVSRGGATPEIQGYHFKKFYFNPVQQ